MQETWDSGSISELRRFPGIGNGKPLQYPCLEIFMDRGDGQAAVHGVAKSWTQQEHPNTLHMIFTSSTESESEKWEWSLSVVSDSLWLHGLCSPPGSFHPWDFLGKSTGVGCHFLLQGNLPDPGIEPGSPALQADALLSEPSGNQEIT